MQKRRIKSYSIGLMFLGVAIFFDVLPWPGLGPGLIQSVTQSLLKENQSFEEVVHQSTPSASERLEVSTQNSLSTRPRNDG